MEPYTSIVLAALYLRGAPRPFEVKRARWVEVVRVLRAAVCEPGAAARILRDAGLWAEAMALEGPGLLEWAERVWASGRCVTAEDPGYPWRCLSGPPVVWVSGELPSLPFLTIVGSREVGVEHRSFARECGAEAVRLGYGVASGGAAGCDREAMRGALQGGGRGMEILPHGLGVGARRPDVCQVTVCAPDEPFSTGSAMERNALLYSVGQAAVVVHARFKSGGTWHGAVEASRRRTTRLLVRDEPGNVAHRALVALGAAPLSAVGGLGEALEGPVVQPKLA